MDLGAYAQIKNLEGILEDNNIEIKRLRGLRLMSQEELISEEYIKEVVDNHFKSVLNSLFEIERCHEKEPYKIYDLERGEYYRKYYLKGNGEPRWDRIHGKLRRLIKFKYKQTEKRVRKQFDTFNKYVGKDNILYIHARTGGNNWSFYGCNEYINTDWFLEKVDDSFDSTYCDIYAKVNIKEDYKNARIKNQCDTQGE